MRSGDSVAHRRYLMKLAVRPERLKNLGRSDLCVVIQFYVIQPSGSRADFPIILCVYCRMAGTQGLITL